MNQYHEDDAIDEMLKFLDNAHDIFAKLFGRDYLFIRDELGRVFDLVMKVVKAESPGGLVT